MKTKIIAYYLPQYHEIQENNNWWGKGFTEWKHVSEAVPLFKGHIQPKIPLNDNYYNLMDKETIEWQTKLSHKYGIYGFAYYHYWFDGKLLLEKPAENLLNWDDIPQKFFFFWANHTWYRAKDGKKDILIEQTDGGKNDWINHYHYMYKFFKDDRYIKINNMPVIGIYNPAEFKNFDAMIRCWRKLALDDGFSGIYIIENKIKVGQRKFSKESNSMVCRQPLVAINQYNLKFYKRVLRKIKKIFMPIPKNPEKIEYSVISALEKNYVPNNHIKEFLGISVGWDNTPRHNNFGQVFINQTVEKFDETLKHLLEVSEKKGNELFFINAWNEWAEGMYLEPDQLNGYSYLKIIKKNLDELERKGY